MASLAPPKLRSLTLTLVVLAALLLAAAPAAHAAQSTKIQPTHVEGSLPSGATYLMDVPADWNGTVLLFSHGYRPAGTGENPPQNATDDATKELLLNQGYALIGSSYASAGWAVTDAVPDQLATLDAFTARFGTARRTLAWGQSYGGFVTTAIAERHADRIAGSLSLCGLLQGGVANWNSTLDPVFALKTLLAPDLPIPLTGFAGQATAAAAATELTGGRHRGAGHAHGPGPNRPGRRPAQHPGVERPLPDASRPDRLGRAAGQPVPGRPGDAADARLQLAPGGREPRGREHVLEHRRRLRRDAAPVIRAPGGRRAVPEGRTAPRGRSRRARAARRGSVPTRRPSSG